MELKRVEVTRVWCGFCSMQVCVIPGATDEEILEVCNSENPSGTSGGWSKVIRKMEDVVWGSESMLPDHCEEYPERIHYLVVC